MPIAQHIQHKYSNEGLDLTNKNPNLGSTKDNSTKLE